MTIRAGGKVRTCHPGIICEKLEQRIVLNATIPPPADNAESTAVQDSADVAQLSDAGDHVAGADTIGGQIEASSDLTQVFENDLNVVLISDALDDIQGISDAAGEDSSVIVYDADKDDFSSLNTLLGDLAVSTGQQIGTLSLFSHGNDGWFSMGTDQLNLFNISSFGAEFAQLSTYLAPDAQIQIYSCSLASDFFGESVVEYIASATGADVFASVDPTGGLSGDWDLEYSSDAQVTMATIIDTQQAADLEQMLAAPYPDFEDNWATALDGDGDGARELYYAYNDGEHGTELWRSDGTAAGTWMVADINVGPVGSNPSGIYVYNGFLVFAATDGASNHGTELWRSDGTAAGTVMVADINPDNQSSNPGGFVEYNGLLYFSAIDGTAASDHGRELWVSDGTAAGTRLFADINAGSLGSNPGGFTISGGSLFFSANDGVSGNELWVSDGTALADGTADPNGTYMVLDINSGGDSNPSDLTDVNGTLFFSANDGPSNHGTELWRSDGTVAGTQMVFDINTGPQGSNPTDLTNVDGILYFAADDGANGTELWRSDGIPNDADHTYMVSDINQVGSQGSNPTELTNVNGVLFFSADDGPQEHGRELWMSDGTDVGTTIVLDINTGPGATGDSNPRFLNEYNGALLFVADDGNHGDELWFSDGTSGGTYLLEEINPAGSTDFVAFQRVNPLYFLADGGDGSGYVLWRSDGTAEGTVRVSDVVPPDSTNTDVAGGSTNTTTSESSDTSTSETSTVDTSTSSTTTSDSSAAGSTASVFGRYSLDSQSFLVGGKYSAAEKDRIGKTPASGLSSYGNGTVAKSFAVQSATGAEATEQAEWQGTSKHPGKESSQDGLPPQFVPGLVKVMVLANGDYSVNLGNISLDIGSKMWLPSLVQWYLGAVSEGNYRFGSLPTDYEQMIWDFLTYLERQKAGDGKNPSEMELRLAWQWAEWRRQVLKEHGTKEVLPWDYFQGLSKSLTLFYGKHAKGKVDYSVAVNALKYNAANLNIIPVKLPEETIAKSGSAPPIRR